MLHPGLAIRRLADDRHHPTDLCARRALATPQGTGLDLTGVLVRNARADSLLAPGDRVLTTRPSKQVQPFVLAVPAFGQVQGAVAAAVGSCYRHPDPAPDCVRVESPARP